MMHCKTMHMRRRVGWMGHTEAWTAVRKARSESMRGRSTMRRAKWSEVMRWVRSVEIVTEEIRLLEWSGSGDSAYESY